MHTKKYYLFVLLNIALQLIANADTIDFWHVYYNGVKIREYNGYVVDIISLKANKLSENDSITLKYFRDTPCFDCATHISVEDSRHKQVTVANGKGTFNPVTLMLKAIAGAGAGLYDVYYSEGDSRKYADRVLLFRIKLE